MRKSELSEGTTIRLHDEAVDRINAGRRDFAAGLGIELHPSRLIGYDEEVVVADMFERANCRKPDAVAVKQMTNNLAVSVSLVDIAEVVVS